LFLKIGINQNEETLYYLVKLLVLPLDSQTQCFRCATVVELRLQQMGDIDEKLHFTMENFKFRGVVKWGLKIFAPNYQKAHPYEQII